MTPEEKRAQLENGRRFYLLDPERFEVAERLPNGLYAGWGATNDPYMPGHMQTFAEAGELVQFMKEVAPLADWQPARRITCPVCGAPLRIERLYTLQRTYTVDPTTARAIPTQARLEDCRLDCIEEVMLCSANPSHEL